MKSHLRQSMLASPTNKVPDQGEIDLSGVRCAEESVGVSEAGAVQRGRPTASIILLDARQTAVRQPQARRKAGAPMARLGRRANIEYAILLGQFGDDA